MDIGGRRATNAATGLSLDARTRSLLVRQANGFTDRGISVLLGGTQHTVESTGADGASRLSWDGQALDDAEALWRSRMVYGVGPLPVYSAGGESTLRPVRAAGRRPLRRGTRVGFGSSAYQRNGARTRCTATPRTARSARPASAGRAAQRRRNKVRPNTTWRTTTRGSVECVHEAGGPHRSGQMAQKLRVPPCPERASGHAWQLAREHSTQDCQAEACEACGLVRMTSYRTGQIIRYERAGHTGGTPLEPETYAQASAGQPRRTPDACGHEEWQAEEVPSVSLTIRFLAVCRECGDERLAVRMVAAGRTTGELGLPQSDDWKSWNAKEMRAAIDYLERKRV